MRFYNCITFCAVSIDFMLDSNADVDTHDMNYERFGLLRGIRSECMSFYQRNLRSSVKASYEAFDECGILHNPLVHACRPSYKEGNPRAINSAG